MNMSEGNFLWLLIIVLSQVASLIANLYSLRRKPPLTEQLYKEFVTKPELSEISTKRDQEIALLKAHNDEVHKEIFAIQRQMQSAHHEDLKIIERTIGTLEGELKRIKGE